MAEKPQTAIARSNRQDRLPAPLTNAIGAQFHHIKTLLPPDTNADQFRAALYLHLQSIRDIGRADPNTVLACIVKLATYGFIPGEDGYIVVFKGKATHIPDYRGLIKVLYRSGMVSKVIANPVYEHDHFVADELSETFEHRRNLKNRGEILCYYSAVWMKDGTRHVQVMHRDDVERVRRGAPGAEQEPWQKYPVEMGRKTTLKNHLKYMRLPGRQSKDLLSELLNDEDRLAAMPPSLAQANEASQDLFGSDIGTPEPRYDEVTGEVFDEDEPDPEPEAFKPDPNFKRLDEPSEKQINYVRALMKRFDWPQEEREAFLDTLKSSQRALEAIELMRKSIDPRQEQKPKEEPPVETEQPPVVDSGIEPTWEDLFGDSREWAEIADNVGFDLRAGDFAAWIMHVYGAKYPDAKIPSELPMVVVKSVAKEVKEHREQVIKSAQMVSQK